MSCFIAGQKREEGTGIKRSHGLSSINWEKVRRELSERMAAAENAKSRSPRRRLHDLSSDRPPSSSKRACAVQHDANKGTYLPRAVPPGCEGLQLAKEALEQRRPRARLERVTPEVEEEVVGWLKALARRQIQPSELKASCIGLAVNEWQNYSDTLISRLARDLLKAWKIIWRDRQNVRVAPAVDVVAKREHGDSNHDSEKMLDEESDLEAGESEEFDSDHYSDHGGDSAKGTHSDMDHKASKQVASEATQDVKPSRTFFVPLHLNVSRGPAVCVDLD